MFRISHAVVTGTAHQVRGIPCQDRIHVCRSGGRICAALADGAGSRAFSHLGADAVTAFVSRMVCEEFPRLRTQPPAQTAREILEATLTRLRELEYPLPELASTLLFFAADMDGNCITGHLGDGVMIHAAGTARVWSHPENGSTPDITWFTTSADAPAHLRIRYAQLDDHGSMLLMSDGAGESLFERSTGTAAPACAVIGQWLRSEEEEKISLALEENMRTIFARRTADDLALAVITW